MFVRPRPIPGMLWCCARCLLGGQAAARRGPSTQMWSGPRAGPVRCGTKRSPAAAQPCAGPGAAAAPSAVGQTHADTSCSPSPRGTGRSLHPVPVPNGSTAAARCVKQSGLHFRSRLQSRRAFGAWDSILELSLALFLLTTFGNLWV